MPKGSFVIIEDGGFRVSGQGAHTDIIMASALAYINALNKLEVENTIGSWWRERGHEL
jgi:hypothetical protein